jgi:hypothetical protein
MSDRERIGKAALSEYPHVWAQGQDEHMCSRLAFIAGAESEAAHCAADWEERVRPLIEAAEEILEILSDRQARMEMDCFTGQPLLIALAAFHASGKDSPDDGGGK